MDVLSSIGSGIGTAASDVGGALSGAFSGLEGLFGGGAGAGAGAAGALPDVGAVAPLAAAAPLNLTGPALTAGTGGANALASSLPGEGLDLTGSGIGELGGGAGGVSALPAQATTVGSDLKGIGPASSLDGLTHTPGISASPTGGGGGGVLSQIFGGGKGGVIPDILKAGLFGLDIANASKPPPGLDALKKLATTQGDLAKTFSAEAGAESQGLLPGGATALIQQNLSAAIAGIQSRYAQMGMSGSSAEIQDINAAKQQALAEQFQIGHGLAQEGMQEVQSASGLQATLLNQILAAETAQGTELGNVLAQFAGATADGGIGGLGSTAKTYTLTPSTT
jgi:hypothetical protein